MCGIAGMVSLNGRPIDPDLLQRMTDVQAHRGPDGEGFVFGWVESGAYRHGFARRADEAARDRPARVGLGHRRLAILDLSERGLQPMNSKDGRAWIVFNGEVYNYLELKKELLGLDHVFRTRTDTEVLLNAYLQWGEDCLSRLEGMYAFAIWDGPRSRLFCARDRLGIKPFYYATTPDGLLAFASESKALLTLPALDASPDDDAVLGFLAHGNCDYAERTLVRQVRALPAAHSLTVDLATGRVAQQSYWSPRPRPQLHLATGERVGRLKELLFGALRKHLDSDVRAGSCLSGGLDSSTVVAVTGKIWREQPEFATSVGDSLYTFTSCWDRPEIDERNFALAVAGSVGATSHLVFPTPEDFWSDFERLAWHQDMPFGGLSFYAQWRVMRAAKEAGVKVLLDGQGGDEVFGGYAKFRYAYLASLLRAGRLPMLLREAWAAVRQGDRYVLDLRNGFRYLPGWVRRLLKVDSLLGKVLKADWGSAVNGESTPATRWWVHALRPAKGGSPWSLMQRVQLDDIVFDTLPQLLRMEDRSSMAFSLEARVPLLDHKLVEYGLSLPDDLKVRDGWSKYAIRQAMDGLLPETVRLRKSKLGFAAPDRAWLLDDLREQITSLLGGELRCQRYVDAAALRRWYQSEEARSANKESYLGLFRILSLEMWMRAFKIR